MMVWTPEQTGTFLDHAADHPLYALLHLMAFRGLRRGEACGLAWPDLDLAAASPTVRENRVKITYQEIEDGDLKTDAGDDTIPLDSGTVTVLRAHRGRREQGRAEWGQAWRDPGKVFMRGRPRSRRSRCSTGEGRPRLGKPGLPSSPRPLRTRRSSPSSRTHDTFPQAT
ncbi:hypothetical protein E1293_14525 [Actinomadura darangshiensis]|uniref:Tyr recombinase domain-containing protein n=1 Tax=Actinomadura darangshiensis TaxID=705336 RepID=A0A4R5BD56_9ACTN|nr:hypothetical protein E1293_14525 [Actinomadura darangshiensis]